LQKSDAKAIAMLGFPAAEASLCALVLGLPGIAFESQGLLQNESAIMPFHLRTLASRLAKEPS
jgi:hypothetical protein